MTSETEDSSPWAEFSHKYHIHPETLVHTARLLEMNVKPGSQTTMDAMRRQAEKFNLTLNGKSDFDGCVEDIVVPGASQNSGHGVPVTVYKPSSRPEAPAILVYFHGGSLIAGSRKTHEKSVEMLAEVSGAIIVNVEYRLLPCATDPMAPFNDAQVVTEWVMANKEAVGGRLTSKVGVGGDSAGGQITCGVTSDIPNGLDFQVLIYPVTDFSCCHPSFDEFRAAPVFNTQALQWRFQITNSPIRNAGDNPRINACVRTDLKLCPPTLLVQAQLDPLRDSCAAYARRLKAAGVKVQTVMVNGVPHGFFSLPGIYKTKTAEAFSHVANFLKLFQ